MHGGKGIPTVDDYGDIRRANRNGVSIEQIARVFEHCKRSELPVFLCLVACKADQLIPFQETTR
jgi:hypothetical protein